ncbi:uncharacterized protein LOC115796256 [Archocentrus centrarchus]|uniref:uncharacterized protein LOC115796256 n=1 Tax=Archocentrus centrarchus TaxID=63155 RepID=UPI0011E9BBBE|nr:uncharacterized protein LOC115796256 [Archocentrus centrarchus]
MGTGAVLFAISLLYVIEAQGLQDVFVLQGKDLHLDIKKPVVLDETRDLFWRFNTKNNIVKITPERKTLLINSYKERVEFRQNYSLLLKNVQHSDSGDYAAVMVGGQEERVAEYKVTVQDPVSPVNLTVTNSSDSCNITVTCSTVDLKISRTFRCDAQNCSQVEEKSLNTRKNFSSLIVYLRQDTIVCNHSNEVSWKQSKVTKLQCEPKPVPNKAIIAGASAGVFIILTVVTLLFSVRK